MVRKLVIPVLVVMALLPVFAGDTAVAQQREENILEAPVAVSVVTAALLEENLQPTDAGFIPIGPDGAVRSSVVRVLATVGITWRIGDPVNDYLARWDVEGQEALSGPQGTLISRDSFNISAVGTSEFYGGQQVVTGYLAKVEPLPEFTSEEIFEMSLAFTWFGEEVLTESIYDSDPLMGYTYSASTSIIGGEAGDGFAKVGNNQWGQYANPLVRFGFTTESGEYYLGYVLPGIPEAAGFTLSFSPELSLDRMIAQHVPVVPIDGGDFPSLGLNWSDLSPDLQLTLVGFEDNVGDGPPVAPTGSTTGQLAPDQPAVAEDPVSDVATDTGPNTTGQIANSGSSSFPTLGLLFAFAISLVLGTGIWWFWRRSTKNPRVLARDDEVDTALIRSLAVPQHLLPEPGKAWWLTDQGAVQVLVEELSRRLVAEGRMIPFLAIADESPSENEAQLFQIRGWHVAALDHRGRPVSRPWGEVSRFSLPGQPDGSPATMRKPEPVTLDSQGRPVSLPWGAVRRFSLPGQPDGPPATMRKPEPVTLDSQGRPVTRSRRGVRRPKRRSSVDRAEILRQFRLRAMASYVDESGQRHLVEDLDPDAPATAEKVAIWVSEDEQVLILADDPKSLMEELTERWPEIDGDDDGPLPLEEVVVPS